MDLLRKMAEQINKTKRGLARHRKAVTAMAAVVVFATTYALVLPALTLDDQTSEKTPGIETETQVQTTDAAGAEEKSRNEEQASQTGDSSRDKTSESKDSSEDGKEGSDKSDSDKAVAGSSKKDNISEKTKLKFDGDGYKVTAEVDADAKLPADTKLKVKEVKENTKDENGEDYDYDAYCDGALKAVRDKDGKDGKQRSREVRLFDISFESDSYDGKGDLEPAAPVKVTIEFDDAIDINDANKVRTVHFDETEKEMKTDVIDTDTKNDGEKTMKEASFRNDKFSVYGVVYTVDFSYGLDGETFEYSIQGGGALGLSDLVEILRVKEDDPDTEENEIGGFISSVETVVFSDPESLSVSKADADTTIGDIKKELGLECKYSSEITDKQIEEIDGIKIASGDWALISLKPFRSEEKLTITMQDGETFIIKVKDAQGTVWDGGADTRSQGITINLFDYGPDSLDNVSNHIGGTVSNAGINQYSDLKFLSYGTEGTTINSFTGSLPNEYAAQGIVQPQLVDGYPALQSDHDSQSLAYLFNNQSMDGKTVYPDVNKLMWSSDGGYKYDSDERYAYYNTSSDMNPNKEFTLYTDTYLEEGADQSNPFKIGFFPFNQYDSDYHCIHGNDFNWGKIDCRHQGHYDHHFGMTMTATFMIDNSQDMNFDFSGDDDMWVFIDDVLVLDIGGIHNPIDGSINFNNGAVSVTRPGSGADARRAVDNQTKAPNTIAEAFARAGKEWNGSGGTYHEIKVFYMERGGMYSNLEIEVKLPTVSSGNVAFDKKNDDNAALEGAEFTLFTDQECTNKLSFKSHYAIASSDSSGKVRFEGLPLGTYYMKETAAPEGYKLDQTVYTVIVRDKNGSQVSEIQKPDGEQVTSIINEEKTTGFDILKVDKGDAAKKLAGAQFTLRRIVEEPEQLGSDIQYADNQSVVSEPTDENGKTGFTNIRPGYYEVKETKVPDGYINTVDNAFYVHVTLTGIKLLEKDLSKAPKQWSEIQSGGIVSSVDQAAGEASARITAVNEPGTELPSAGGPGTTWMYILGAMLTLGAGIMLVSRRKMRAGS